MAQRAPRVIRRSARSKQRSPQTLYLSGAPVARIMKTYDINEAADFLKIDRSTALELASVGTLPGAKVGRAWVFMEDELVAYLRDATRKQTQTRRANAEASRVLEQAQREPRPRRRGRRRALPNLPELGGQVASS